MDLSNQRWARPIDVEPGHWKKQIPIKTLRIAAGGDIKGLRDLLAADSDSLNRRGNHGRTLLWEAVRAGKREAVEYLVDCGADVSLTGCYGSESHVQLTPHCAAVYYGRASLVSYLADLGEAPDIFRQAFLGEEKTVIAEVGADPLFLGAEDPQDKIYFIPLLSFAVVGGHRGLAGRLIALGAEVAVYSAQLLFLAARAGRIDLIELLVAEGADTRFMETALISAKDIVVFRRLLQLHAEAGRALPEDMTLIPFVRGDRAERPDKLATLLDYGVPIDARGPGKKTALHLASKSGLSKVITLLLERGADPSLKDEEGRTPLDAAVAAGKQDAAAGLKGH